MSISQPRYRHREPAIDLWQIIHRNYPDLTDHEYALLAKAYKWSVVLHTHKKRKSGESYYRHDCRCAIRAALMKAPIKLVIVMLLHEFIEDDGWTKEQIAAEFDEEIAEIVDAISKRPKEDFAPPLTRNHRVNDHTGRIKTETPKRPLVIVAKADDRLDNITDTSCLDEISRDRLFKETEEIFLPMFFELYEFVPKNLQPFYLAWLQEIQFACDNYWRSPTLTD